MFILLNVIHISVVNNKSNTIITIIHIICKELHGVRVDNLILIVMYYYVCISTRNERPVMG